MELQSLFIYLVWGLTFLCVLYYLFRSIKIVPQKSIMLVERLGRYNVSLASGFHILIPFFDRVAYHLDLKEESIDVPPQECFTQDEVRVVVDGVIYISVSDPVKAAYGVMNYRWAAMQLAQTTTRSIIGTISLDRTFEEREYISAKVIEVLEQTSLEWGIKVHRYEIKNIAPPKSVQTAMEKQVTAERERRAIVAKSDGEKQSRINKSEGYKLELINNSQGEMRRRINEAEGKASEIKALAEATAISIEQIAEAIESNEGEEAVKLQLTETYLAQYGKIANKNTEVLVPMDVTNVNELIRQ